MKIYMIFLVLWTEQLCIINRIATNVKDGDSMFNNNAYLDSTVVMNDKCTFNLLRAAEEDLLPKT